MRHLLVLDAYCATNARAAHDQHVAATDVALAADKLLASDRSDWERTMVAHSSNRWQPPGTEGST